VLGKNIIIATDCITLTRCPRCDGCSKRGGRWAPRALGAVLGPRLEPQRSPASHESSPMASQDYQLVPSTRLSHLALFTLPSHTGGAKAGRRRFINARHHSRLGSAKPATARHSQETGSHYWNPATFNRDRKVRQSPSKHAVAGRAGPPLLM
jgi:hypothetical protein